ncbi:unnamed protein product [Blepharisma stoltei]|uniref:Inosine/uridine-preferring nucleoside hydrolase domain-containing protein n=1 Tax=Blepharisma stoltei TaxID=1481888 RepID=A0AAU9ITP7_9CILI|nr:unnamed protein product [Blepharisma stoltei]
MSKNMWIIDTDAGVDDAQALVLALKCQEYHNFEVVAITSVAGNVPLPQVNKNIGEILRVCNKTHIPYYSGSAKPLINDLTDCASIHGVDGLNNYWSNPSRGAEDIPEPQSKHAVQAIIDIANEHPGQVSIATIGPLTNLALAVCLDPALPTKFKRVLVMGAAVHGKGNITVSAEFNIWCDPEASHIVFERFPLLEIVPWETCIDREHKFTSEFLNSYTHGATPQGNFVREITTIVGGESHVFFCDPITICIAIDESIAKEYSLRKGFVELNGGYTRGMTVVNWGCSDMKEINEGGDANLKIVEKLDLEKIMALFLHSIS